MRELITAVLLALRWLAYLLVTLLIPVVVMVPVVITVEALPFRNSTTALTFLYKPDVGAVGGVRGRQRG